MSSQMYFCVEVKANRNTLSNVLDSDMQSRIRAIVLPLQNSGFMEAHGEDFMERRIPDITKVLYQRNPSALVINDMRQT